MAAVAGDSYPSLTVSLRKSDTTAPECARLADFLYDYFMTPASPGVGYGRYQFACSIIALPKPPNDFLSGPESAYARRRIRRAAREGYTFGAIDPNLYVDDIYEINTSLEERQGRPMDEAYRRRPEPLKGPLAYGCPRHREVWYGLLKDRRLIAYTWVYQVGDMCLFNRILGHGAHMHAGVMYQLVARVVEDLIATADLRFAMYERHTSGTEGLRLFKERMGFRAYWVDWQLADEDIRSTRPAFERRGAVPNRTSRAAIRRVARRVRGLLLAPFARPG